ncbi:MAG: hypothetical protein WCW93_01205 [Candidatus Paceibacterota bacterium]
MAGPYFKGQEPAICGCYYPDVVRIQDDIKKNTRTLFCITHGMMHLSLKHFPGAAIRSRVEEIPSDEWREKERTRLQNIK